MFGLRTKSNAGGDDRIDGHDAATTTNTTAKSDAVADLIQKSMQLDMDLEKHAGRGRAHAHAHALARNGTVADNDNDNDNDNSSTDGVRGDRATTTNRMDHIDGMANDNNVDESPTRSTRRLGTMLKNRAQRGQGSVSVGTSRRGLSTSNVAAAADEDGNNNNSNSNSNNRDDNKSRLTRGNGGSSRRNLSSSRRLRGTSTRGSTSGLTGVPENGTGTGTGTGGDNHSASAVYSAIAAASAVDKPPCEVVVLIGHAQQNHIRHFRRSAAAAASSSSSGRYRKVSESSNSSDAENYNAAINAANYEGVEEHKSSEEDVWAAAGEHYNQQAMRNSGTTYTSSSFLHQNENIVRNDGERTMHKNASHRSIGSRDRSTFLRRTPSASSSRSADVSMTEQRNSVRDLVKKFDQYGKQRTMNGKFDRATSMSSYQSRSSRREKRKKSKVDGNYLDGSKVRFSDVEIREYQRVIGDNPSCSNGPPMSIGWRYNILGKMSVGDFEQTRMDANDVYGGRMKKVPVTLLTREKREQLLENFGFSRAELADAVRRNIKIKNQRRQTVHNLPVSKFEEAVEKVSRKIKKVVMPNYKNCPR
mmetsp:Transcript_5620/g.8259  ORF Transcript_5620/g.8259 Transcript_5620/m.8259 type:complete len:588 (+) Transcript_5620:220-1983(+)